jgi:hypothetical protein
MIDCKISIEEYFNYQNALKKNLNNLSTECPELVIKYLLKLESRSRIKKLLDCSYTDKFDIKLYRDIQQMKNCDTFKNICK